MHIIEVFSPYKCIFFSLVIERSTPIENKLVKQNMRSAVISLLKRKHVKNPHVIVEISNSIYSHTNFKGITHIYYVFTSFTSYKKFILEDSHKLYKINTFYIAEKEGQN